MFDRLKQLFGASNTTHARDAVSEDSDSDATTRRVVNTRMGDSRTGPTTRQGARLETALDAVRGLSLAECFAYDSDVGTVVGAIPDDLFGGSAVTQTDTQTVRFLVTRTPTESELADVVDSFGHVLWNEHVSPGPDDPSRVMRSLSHMQRVCTGSTSGLRLLDRLVRPV